jgi:hypothetical protein
VKFSVCYWRQQMTALGREFQSTGGESRHWRVFRDERFE